MAGAGTGFGSALVIRAKEARARAQAAQAFGIVSSPSSPPSSGTGSGLQTNTTAPLAPVTNQPVVSPDLMPDLNKRLYGVAEAFLMGLSGQLHGGDTPKDSGNPPTSIVPGAGAEPSSSAL